MTEQDQAARIEEAVTAVPGVTTLYPAGTAAALAEAGAALVGNEKARVAIDDESVDVAIGIDGSHAAPEVARATHDAVAGLVDGDAEVRVTVVRIEPARDSR